MHDEGAAATMTPANEAPSSREGAGGLPPAMPGRTWRRWVTLSGALLLLNVSLSFGNLWPTPLVTWRGELSIELAAGILLLLAATRPGRRVPRRMLAAVPIVWLLFVVARYVEVTADALYGRELNLYWDRRYIPDVVAMLVRAVPVWLTMLTGAAAGLCVFASYRFARMLLGRLFDAAAVPLERRAMGVAAALVVALFSAEQLIPAAAPQSRFAKPVTRTYARQVQLMVAGITGATSLPPSPPLQSDLSLAKDADVFLIFVESYGAISWQRPALVDRLRDSRQQFESAIRDTGRDIVSAYVTSPTFGGASWLAHISLMSGLEVTDPDTNALLMTQKRDTVVGTFSRAGYRVVALMPGLWFPWPEGAFYGFDTIYRADRLDYQGPPFGWWTLPDQFSLARLDALEVSPPSRQPLFVFFPTVNTHTPFSPTPPYQPDWSRVLTGQPFDAADVNAAYEQWADWTDLGPGYANALDYTYQYLAGYLRLRAERDLILIVIGDHQPPAAVSGEGAVWSVPVHVIGSRRAVIERLVASGFRPGLTPRFPDLGKMHTLLPVLLDAFGHRSADAVSGDR
jgi:hypothetical protein